MLWELAKEGDVAITIDLTDGYYHLGMHQSAWPYMGFPFGGNFYYFKVLPFGLSIAPWVFSKVMREIVGYWRAMGMRLINYLDDFFHLLEEMWAEREAQKVLDDLKLAGLMVNWSKSVTAPGRVHTVLGTGVDLGNGIYFVPPEKWEKLQELHSRCVEAEV